MLTRLIIGGFKAIDDVQEVDLRPITLLFGPNAAGKSSVFHAVHYLFDVLSGSGRDVRFSGLSGRTLDLGGFDQVVHGRDPMGRITLGIEASNEADTLRGQYPLLQYQDGLLGDSEAGDELRPMVEHFRLEVILGRQRPGEAVVALEWRIEINHEPLATIRLDDPQEDLEPSLVMRLSLSHPIVAEAIQAQRFRGSPEELVLAATGGVAQIEAETRIASLKVVISDPDLTTVHARADALPSPTEFVRVVKAGTGEGAMSPGFSLDEARLFEIFTLLMVEPVRHARVRLRDAVHLGPLRGLPPREDTRSPTSERNWYDGSVAWQMLEFSRVQGGVIGIGRRVQITLDWVNRFLHENNLLNTGLELRFIRTRSFRDNRGEIESVQEQNDTTEPDEAPLSLPEIDPFPALWEVPDEGLQALSRDQLIDVLRRIRTASLELPYTERIVLYDRVRKVELTTLDVGVGVGQVIPVLVAIFNQSVCELTMLEQPELHLHPKAQVALADALIIGAEQRDWSMVQVCETHSEHVLLRLLRRLRETAAGKLAEDSPLRIEPDQLAVIYVERTPTGARLQRLRVDEAGRFLDRWPEGFFDERTKELFS